MGTSTDGIATRSLTAWPRKKSARTTRKPRLSKKAEDAAAAAAAKTEAKPVRPQDTAKPAEKATVPTKATP